MTGFAGKYKAIGKHEITVRKLPMSKGRALLVRLLGLLAPSLGEALAKGADLRAVAGSINASAIGGGLLSGLGERLDDATVEYAADCLGSVSKARDAAGVELDMSKSTIRDVVFDGDYLAFFEWLSFGLEVQYADFFRGLLEKLGAESEAPKPSA